MNNTDMKCITIFTHHWPMTLLTTPNQIWQSVHQKQHRKYSDICQPFIIWLFKRKINIFFSIQHDSVVLTRHGFWWYVRKTRICIICYSARDKAIPLAKYACFWQMDAKIWMISLIIMLAVRPICVQDSFFKMSSSSPDVIHTSTVQ